MLAGVSILQLVGVVFAIVFGAAAFVGLIAGSIYVVRSRKITVNNTLADSAVQSLQAANQGLESRLAIVEQESAHCHEMKRQQDIVIAQLQGSVDELRSWVTARDLIQDLTAITRAGFLAMHVDPAILEIPKTETSSQAAPRR